MKSTAYTVFLVVSIAWLCVSNKGLVDFTHSYVPLTFQVEAVGANVSMPSGAQISPTSETESDPGAWKTCGKDGLITGTNVCAPRIIIGGAMKCGTNEMMRLLSLHPRVQFRLCDPSTTDQSECNPTNYQGAMYNGQKEVWEFSPGDFVKNISAFANRLARVDGSTNITTDKSSAFFLSASPSAVMQLMPNTKFVMTICDPSERIVSHYYHMFRNEIVRERQKRRIARFAPNLEFSKFEDFAQIMDGTSNACKMHPKECELFQKDFLQHGDYSEIIQKWYRIYPQSSFLILNMEAPSQENVKRLLEFANLPPEEYPWGAEDGPRKYVNDNNLTRYRGRSQEWSIHPNLMEHLSRIYNDSNEKLANLTGEEYPRLWGKRQHQISSHGPSSSIESHGNPKRPIFVLHIGPRKTGTTSLQCFLGQNNRILKQNNFHYLGHFWGPNCGMADTSHIPDHPQDVPRQVLMAPCIKCDPKEEEEEEEECDCEEAWNEFSDIVNAHYQAGHNVIMCDEMFVHYSETGHVEKLASLLSKWHVRVILAYRDLYQQHTSTRFEHYNPYGEHGNFEEWPDSGGTRIPSVKADYDQQKGSSDIFLSQVSMWSGAFENFVVVNMHHDTNFLSNMLCTMVPEAKAICSYASNTTDETVHNPSSAKPLHFDMVAVAAREQGILQKKNITRSEARDRIEDYFAKQGKTLLAHFPLSCLSETDQAHWKEETREFAEALYPRFDSKHKIGISNILSNASSRFQTYASKQKFCSVNTDLVLKEPSLRVRLRE